MRGNGILRTAILLVAVLFLAAIPSAAGTITQTYYFERPEIKSISIDGTMYDRIIMPDVPNAGIAGEPALPAFGATILLPYGEEIESVSVNGAVWETVAESVVVEPRANPYPLSKPELMEVPTPKSEIYLSRLPFPEDRFEAIGEQVYRGYRMAIIKLHPTIYFPADGKLMYAPELEVTITTRTAARTIETFRGLPEDELAVSQRVDNPDAVTSYYAAQKRGSRNYSMLIITTSALAPSFQPLKNYHDSTGLPTEIHLTTDIGGSAPATVRAHILDEYSTNGIEYVIIGADDDIIPAIDLWVESSPGGEVEYDMPGDIYFACLDGTWNYDGDSRNGEPTDGPGGGDVDMVAEVYVGRCAAGNTAEVDRFVNKTLQYVASSSAYLQKALLVGEHLGFGGVSEYAANTMNELEDGCSTHGYTTVGIPSAIFEIDKLYEADYTWPKADLINKINNNVHILNHLGHGSPDYAMKLYNSDLTASINNVDHCLVYSQTCLAGHLDGTDCWAEYANIKIDGGAFAVVMNSRYGWGEWNSTDGPSQRFNREFWDAIFSGTEMMVEIGKANQDSKEDNLYRINESCMRWCTYELNLFGDPSIALRGTDGIRFTYPNGIPEIISPYVTASFEVLIENIGDGQAVPGTGIFHYTINGKAPVAEPMEILGPNHYRATFPELTCGDLIEFYISAEEISEGVMYDPDPALPRTVDIVTDTAVIFEDDFETDKGWTVTSSTWSRGTPTGSGGSYGYPDPASAYSGANVYGYNLNGDYTNNMPERHLTSPAFDCSDKTGVTLSFMRWLGVEQPTYDHAYIRISTDGSNWTTVWENTQEVADNAWLPVTLDVSTYADNEPVVYLRFTMGTTDGGWTYCGWNIDDLMVYAQVCEQAPLTIVTTDLPDWTVQCAYSQQLQAIGGSGNHTWTDMDNGLDGTGLTLSSSGAVTGTPTIEGPISFTAGVSDESLAFMAQELSFTVNPPVVITSDVLPEFDISTPVTCTLSVAGGTGQKAWSDVNLDLDGTGFTLSPEGVITGQTDTPVVLIFTAQAIDPCNGADQKELTLTIKRPYICGDASGDGEVNISDVILLVNYIFKSGPAPEPLEAADANCDSDINVADGVYVINYVFNSGPAPCCP